MTAFHCKKNFLGNANSLLQIKSNQMLLKIILSLEILISISGIVREIFISSAEYRFIINPFLINLSLWTKNVNFSGYVTDHTIFVMFLKSKIY